MFADDTRVTKVIKKIQNIAEIQGDLEKMYQWNKDNTIVFIATQFEVKKHCSNEELKNENEYLTPDCENLIEIEEPLRNLGIIMNKKANFEDHINKVFSTINQTVSWIM